MRFLLALCCAALLLAACRPEVVVVVVTPTPEPTALVAPTPTSTVGMMWLIREGAVARNESRADASSLCVVEKMVRGREVVRQGDFIAVIPPSPACGGWFAVEDLIASR